MPRKIAPPHGDPAWLKHLRIQEFERPIADIPPKELAEFFRVKPRRSRPRGTRVLARHIIRSIVWQTHQRLLAGTIEPLQGNVRTLYYREVAPVMEHLPSTVTGIPSAYVYTVVALRELALDAGLIRYAPFNFTDEQWEYRRIGTTRPHIVVFSEKESFIRHLRWLHETHGVTIQAHEGQPSAVTSHYLTEHVRPLLSAPDAPVTLIGITDWDPGGHIIAHAFHAQLVQLGLNALPPVLPVVPSAFTANERALFGYPLNPNKGRVRNWLAECGADPTGFSADALPWPRLSALINAAIRAEPQP